MMELPIVREANRCLTCKKPMCQLACPIHTPVPTIIQLFRQRKLEEAGKILFENNPLSAICASVCNHEQQCMGHCVLGRKSDPVRFFDIERYISEMYLSQISGKPVEKKDQKVAIIGAGPAGIAAALLLAGKGYRVTIFEWHSKVGGIMQYGIPEFRLPKSLLEQYRQQMEAMGIQIRFNTTIGAVLMIDDLLRDGYASVFIATGAEKPLRLGIPGETLGNVHFGLNYLTNPDAYRLGQRVAIIGMGNAAMDVARTALRHGAREVSLYARGKTISASSSEADYARLDGATFAFGMQIHSITEEGPIFQKAIFDEENKIIGYEDSLIQERADSVIISISQMPRKKLVRTTAGLEADDRGRLVVDENYMTTRSGVFAAGDVVSGAKTVVHAVAGAKEAVQAMIQYMEQNG